MKSTITPETSGNAVAWLDLPVSKRILERMWIPSMSSGPQFQRLTVGPKLLPDIVGTVKGTGNIFSEKNQTLTASGKETLIIIFLNDIGEKECSSFAGCKSLMW